MNFRLTSWLETHWVNPAYGGWLAGGLAVFFFAAATNTMAGWLYAISGAMVAVLVVAMLLPVQTLRGIHLHRASVAPVSVGDDLVLELSVQNQTQQPKTLIQLIDQLPPPLLPIRTAIEHIPAQGSYRWVATLPAQQRGIYRWQTVQLRTAAPLGLFWCRRSQVVPAKVVIYPTVLTLAQSPIVDEIGPSTRQPSSYYQSRLANEGLTRTLRPYRWGDSTRLVHWRSSARSGELRVRELETQTSGQELVIGLDSGSSWDRKAFEQAVVAAASLYFYARRRQIRVSLWTAGSGLLSGDPLVLEALAAVQPHELRYVDRPELPLLWLTQAAACLSTLPAGSRWLLWAMPEAIGQSLPADAGFGKLIYPEQPLQPQLQAPIC